VKEFSYTVASAETILDESIDGIVWRVFELERLVALLLSKAGGVVEFGPADLMELDDRRPTIVEGPPTMNLTLEVRLIDKHGDPWRGSENG
jgi:hypothetical protein